MEPYLGGRELGTGPLHLNQKHTSKAGGNQIDKAITDAMRTGDKESNAAQGRDDRRLVAVSLGG